MSEETAWSPDDSVNFLSAEERELNTAFLERGYISFPVSDVSALNSIRRAVAEISAQHLGVDLPEDIGTFLNHIHQRVGRDKVNDLRLAVIGGMNALPWLRPAYYAVARSVVEAVVGNELCMQKRVNLSVQLPHDHTSVLPLHADVWSGDSPYEVVVWLPLVDCWGAKSMYITPPDADRAVSPRMAGLGSTGRAFDELEPQLEYLTVPYGNVLVFNQNLPHGNIVNSEEETRWSLNCRFKAVLSPYADKKVGEFFEPITLRAAARVGMRYSLPGGFDD